MTSSTVINVLPRGEIKESKINNDVKVKEYQSYKQRYKCSTSCSYCYAPANNIWCPVPIIIIGGGLAFVIIYFMVLPAVCTINTCKYPFNLGETKIFQYNMTQTEHQNSTLYDCHYYFGAQINDHICEYYCCNQNIINSSVACPLIVNNTLDYCGMTYFDTSEPCAFVSNEMYDANTSWYKMRQYFAIVWWTCLVLIPIIHIIIEFCCRIRWKKNCHMCKTQYYFLLHWQIEEKYNITNETFNKCIKCKEDYDNCDIVILLPCNHLIHCSCLVYNITNKNITNCPYCKRSYSQIINQEELKKYLEYPVLRKWFWIVPFIKSQQEITEMKSTDMQFILNIPN